MLSKWAKIIFLAGVLFSIAGAQETLVSLARSISVETQGGQQGTVQVSLLVTNEAPGGANFPVRFQGSLAGQNLGVGSEAVLYVYRNGQWYASLYSGAISHFDGGTLWKNGDTLELVFAASGAPTWPPPPSQRLSYTIGGATSQRTVAYHFDLTNTSLQTRTVTLQVGLSDVRSENVPPYENRTIDGQFTANDGTTASLVAAVDLIPKSGAPYDPFVVSAANTSLSRAYFIGNDPTKMVQCTLIAGVAKANGQDPDRWVEIRAGGVVLLRGTVRGETTDYQWFKVSVPLPVGTELGLVGQVGTQVFKQPNPATVALNNAQFEWVAAFADSNTAPAWAVTSYDNGTMILERPTQGAPGATNYVPGQTVQVNTNQLPSNGTGANLGQGVVGQTGVNPTVPGVTVVTGPSAGNGGSLLDNAALQAIASNTAQIAQNTKPQDNNADGLGSTMPEASRLEGFQPDTATQNALRGMNPLDGKSIPVGQAPEVTLPFGELGVDGFSNQTLSFSNTNLNGWVGVVRSFLLFCISAFFAYHHVKLISKTLGNL